jgi:putative cell wall-binding protein
MKARLGIVAAAVAVTLAVGPVGAPAATALASPASDRVSSAAGAWNPAVTRLAGHDRYETSAIVSKQLPMEAIGTQTVYLASGEAYPDALSAASALQTLSDRMLLVKRNSIPTAVRAELIRLQPRRIVIIGGDGVVGAGVERELRRMPLRNLLDGIQRIGGKDRYATSVLVADAARVDSGLSGSHVSTVVTGRDFPDALAAVAARQSSAAAAWPGPVLLVKGETASPGATALRVLRDYGTVMTRIVGGTGAVSAEIERALPSPERYAGNDRYATAAVLNNRSAHGLSGIAYLATGRNFPDALSASAAASVLQAPLFLVPRTCVPRYVLSELERMSIRTIRIVGGTGVVSPDVARLTPCAEPAWLTQLNAARASFGALPLSEDPRAAGGVAAHIAYNRANGLTADWQWQQDPTNSHATAIGAEYDESSLLMSGGTLDIAHALRSPFQLAQLLDASSDATGAALVGDGALGGIWAGWSLFGPIDREDPETPFATWPAHGSLVPSSALTAVKARPNAYQACPVAYQERFASPSAELGAPILFRVPWSGGSLSAELLADGHPVEACLVAPQSWPPDPLASEFDAGLRVLAAGSSALLLPLEPLRPGVEYRVNVVAQGSPYSSTFDTAP